MKSSVVAVFVMFLAACGSREDADHASTSASEPASSKVSEAAGAAQTPPAQGEVTDEKIGMPAYPGAREVEYSRIKQHSDIGDTFGVSYQTADTPMQVAAFYRAEAPKVGTLKESLSPSEQLQSVSVSRTDGSQSAIQATSNGKGTTVVSVQRFFPAK